MCVRLVDVCQFTNDGLRCFRVPFAYYELRKMSRGVQRSRPTGPLLPNDKPEPYFLLGHVGSIDPP